MDAKQRKQNQRLRKNVTADLLAKGLTRLQISLFTPETWRSYGVTGVERTSRSIHGRVVSYG